MRKWISLALSIVAVIALPAAFLWPILTYHGPGAEYFWLILAAPSAMQFLPFMVMVFVPFIIPVFNTLYVGKKIPKFSMWLQICFFMAWFTVPVILRLGAYEIYTTYYLYVLAIIGVALLLLLAHIIHSIAAAIIRKRQGGKFWTRSAIIMGIIFGLIILLGLSAYFVADSYYRGRYNAVKQSLESIEEKILEPQGAVKWENPRYSAGMEGYGNGLMDLKYCNGANSCPKIVHTWLVPVELGKEKILLDKIATENGFTSSIKKYADYCIVDDSLPYAWECSNDGVNGTLYISVRMESLKSFESNQIPRLNNESPKVWRGVAIELTRTWGN